MRRRSCFSPSRQSVGAPDPGKHGGIAFSPSSSLSGFNCTCPAGLEEQGWSALNYSRLEQILNR